MNLDFIKRQYRQGLKAGSNEEIIGLLEPGIEFEGKVKVTSGMIRLNCRFKGSIESAGTVIVASEGDVEADIDAAQISIAGKLKGNVRTTKQLEITEKGILLGNVETPLIKVDTGAYFTGHCEMPTHRVEQLAAKEEVLDPEPA